MSTTHYINGFQYFDHVLQFFPTPEGYVKNTPMMSGGYSFDYVYNYTDHLGNIRLSYTQDPQTGALAILEEQHYYPFGLRHANYNSDLTKIDREEALKTLKEVAPPLLPLQNPGYAYKFNGKELQIEFGVEMYDFGARNYDPALGRWMNIDPLAEKMRRHSPYNYAFNNPIYFIDPDGMEGMGAAMMGSGQITQEMVGNSAFGSSQIGSSAISGGLGSMGGGEKENSGSESVGSNSNSNETPTKFVDEGGSTIANPDEGNNQTFVITKDNEDKFIEKLRENIGTNDDLSVEKNKELGNKYGYDLKEHSKNVDKGVSKTNYGKYGSDITNHREAVFKIGYEEGYSGNVSLTNEISKFDPDGGSSSRTMGESRGVAHRLAGRMNAYNPQLKNNAPFIKTNTPTTPLKNYNLSIGGGRTVQTFFPIN